MKKKTELDRLVYQATKSGIKRRPITESEIRAAETPRRGYTKQTLKAWGVPDFMQGWKRLILKNGVPLLDLSQEFRMQAPVRAPRTIKSQPEQQSPSSKAQREAFYLSWEWRTLRMEVLQEQGRVCKCCGVQPGDIGPSGIPTKIVVDHIKPLSRFWHLRLTKGNLQVLCDECNQGKGAWHQTDFR